MKELILRTGAIKHEYRAVKFNKCDIQYEITSALPEGTYLTERVKIEKFQGFSKAQNLWEYFRLRGATSWKAGEQVTGLWKTENPLIHFGDRKTKKGKSLVVFVRSQNHERLIVYTFKEGFYPSRSKIEEIIKSLR